MGDDRGDDQRPDPLTMLRRSTPPPWPLRLRALVERVPREARPWAAAAVALVVLLAALGMWSVTRPQSTSRDATSAAVDAAIAELPMAGTAPAAPTTSAAASLVHVAGAVRAPGVYQVAPGARVDDVVEAAGGLAEGADADRLNLAAAVADGARVYVPRVGELAPPPALGPEADVAVPSAGTGSGGAGQVDLNRADEGELETLPGVGPSIAGAIVAHRDRSGPFASVDDLLDVRGIGPARLEQLRPLVRV